jgi:hypothetical protein
MEKNPKSSYPKMKIRHGGKDGELNVCYRTWQTSKMAMMRSSGDYLWLASDPNHKKYNSFRK